MNNSIQSEAEAQDLRREIPFPSIPEDSTSIKDPDRMLSIIVLVLACLGLALLAHVVV
jgi:hypothetical protein